MSIFETVGLVWVIFTSAFSTVAIIYLAYVGLKQMVNRQLKESPDVRVEVKEMFKVAR